MDQCNTKPSHGRLPKVEGELGYYGLAEWWLSSFTEQEREYIETRYTPMGIGGTDNSRPLTRGQILDGGTGRASQLLWGLATWFRKPEDFHIARRILAKAEEVAVDPRDFHFTYQGMIQLYYRMRDADPMALDWAIDACGKQIRISFQVAERMKSEYAGQPLPHHVGYTQLAVIREKQKNYAEAVRLAKQAKEQGWAGDWDKRIARCEKRAATTRT